MRAVCDCDGAGNIGSGGDDRGSSRHGGRRADAGHGRGNRGRGAWGVDERGADGQGAAGSSRSDGVGNDRDHGAGGQDAAGRGARAVGASVGAGLDGNSVGLVDGFGRLIGSDRRAGRRGVGDDRHYRAGGKDYRGGGARAVSAGVRAGLDSDGVGLIDGLCRGHVRNGRARHAWGHGRGHRWKGGNRGVSDGCANGDSARKSASHVVRAVCDGCGADVDDHRGSGVECQSLGHQDRGADRVRGRDRGGSRISQTGSLVNGRRDRVDQGRGVSLGTGHGGEAGSKGDGLGKHIAWI